MIVASVKYAFCHGCLSKYAIGNFPYFGVSNPFLPLSPPNWFFGKTKTFLFFCPELRTKKEENVFLCFLLLRLFDPRFSEAYKRTKEQDVASVHIWEILPNSLPQFPLLSFFYLANSSKTDAVILFFAYLPNLNFLPYLVIVNSRIFLSLIIIGFDFRMHKIEPFCSFECKKGDGSIILQKSKLHAAALLWPRSEKGAGDNDNAFPES